jgi:hypothetical protein
MVVKENMVLPKNIFDPEKKEMEGDFTTLHNESFIIFFSRQIL